MTQSTVSLIVTRNKPVTTLAVLERIADGLDMPDDARMHLGLAPKEVDTMRRRTALGLGLMAALNPSTLADVLGESAAEALEFTRERAVSAVGTGTLEHLAAVAAELYRRYPGRSAAELFPIARAYRRRVAQLIEGRHTFKELRELYVRAADLSDLLSDLAFDLGSPVTAEAWAIDAYRHADEAGHNELCAWANGARSTIALYAGQPAKSITHARAGIGMAPRNSPMSIRLRARAARAHADQGNQQAATELLADAQALCEQLPDNAPSRLATESAEYTADSLAAAMAGCHARLGNWKDTERHAHAALVARSVIPGWAEQAQIDLAIALANLGRPDEAVDHGKQALGSSRGWLGTLVPRARVLDAVLTRQYATKPCAQEFHYHYRELANPAITN
jgi:tetratricopeptide (TPR) repeat protein